VARARDGLGDTDEQHRSDHGDDEAEHVQFHDVAGLIIGALARLIKPGKQNLGIIATLLLGLVGSVIGGVIANLLGTGDIMELNVLGFIVAVIASVLLIGVAESVSGSRHKSYR